MIARVIGAVCLMGVAGCMTPTTPELDWSLEKVTKEGKFRVALEPPLPVPPLQEIHAWNIRLMKPDGTPIEKGLVYLNGGMPEHGHGLPTRPTTVGEVAPGVYRVEGVKFNMPGRWELVVAIQANGTEDFAYFNAAINLPKAK